MTDWMHRNLENIGQTTPCKICRDDNISVGCGYCYDHFKEELTRIILDQYPITGKNVVNKD